MQESKRPIITAEQIESPVLNPDRVTRSLRRASLNRMGWLASVFILLSPIGWTDETPASDTDSRPLLSDMALSEALRQRRGLSVVSQSLRQASVELQRATGIPVLLDRRVDPSRPLNVSTGYVTAQETLTSLAKAAGAQVSFGDRVAMIGPPAAMRRLRTVIAVQRSSVMNLRRQMAADKYSRLIAERDYSWPNLSRPGTLLSEAARNVGLAISNLEAVPHDVWGAGRLPKLTFTDFATLILNQYDLSLELTPDGNVRFLAVAEDIVMERRHRIPVREKTRFLKQVSNEFPNLDLTWKGSAAVVRSSVEVHERLEQIISGSEFTAVSAAGIRSRRFTMQTPAGGAPLSAVMDRLQKSGVPIKITGLTPEGTARLLMRKMKIDLRDSPAEEFLSAAFSELGARIVITDESVTLSFPEQ